MAQIHSHNAFVAFEDANSASRNLSGDGNNCSLTDSENHPESTAYGQKDISRSPSSLGDIKFTVEAWANDTATTANMAVFYGLKGLPTQLSFAPGGSCTAAGAASPVKYTACMVIDDVEVTSPVDGLTKFRASLSLRSGSLNKNNVWSTTFG